MVEVVDTRISQLLDADLQRVEAALLSAVEHVDPLIGEGSRHLVDAGGKRLRPLLTLLAGRLGPSGDGSGSEAATEEVLKAAVVVELTHLASLHHDDVMDEALLRRGVESANARFGNSVAILTGDLLFARASLLVADLGADAVRIQAATFGRLCTGQIHETVGPQPGDDPVEHYLSVLSDKTGSLIATAGLFGARFGGSDPAVVDVLCRYGERVGVAFQLADDVLDLASEASESGKTPGTDLREGIATLPVLLAQRSRDPGDERLHELLASDLSDDDAHAEVLTLLRAHPALTEARAVTRRWADDAESTLAPLPAGPVKDALVALARGVVDRSG